MFLSAFRGVASGEQAAVSAVHHLHAAARGLHAPGLWRAADHDDRSKVVSARPTAAVAVAAENGRNVQNTALVSTARRSQPYCRVKSSFMG